MAAIRLRPRRVAKPWGRRDLGAMFGPVPEGEEPIGEIWFEEQGAGSRDLLVKYLFTSERLSIQVHPDGESARARGERSGKDEAWVILSAEPGAEIGIGLTAAVSREELRAAALEGRLEHLVDWRPAATGDVFYSPAGTIHAIGPGLTLVEIQQNVDLTYRLYDYGRPRELHLDEAVAAARPEPFSGRCTPTPAGEGRSLLCRGPAFRLERWSWSGAQPVEADSDRPVWLAPLAGLGRIGGESIEPGSVWLVDSPETLTLEGGADLLSARPA